MHVLRGAAVANRTWRKRGGRCSGINRYVLLPFLFRMIVPFLRQTGSGAATHLSPLFLHWREPPSRPDEEGKFTPPPPSFSAAAPGAIWAGGVGRKGEEGSRRRRRRRRRQRRPFSRRRTRILEWSSLFPSLAILVALLLLLSAEEKKVSVRTVLWRKERGCRCGEGEEVAKHIVAIARRGTGRMRGEEEDY